jgi:N-acetylglucosamine malate deacetylase 2
MGVIPIPRGAVWAVASVILVSVLGATEQRRTSRPVERPRILCVFAHPDDEQFMSGTLALAARQGCEIYTIYMTSGDRGKDASGQRLVGPALAEAREAEAGVALRTLGISQTPFFARLPDSPHFPDVDSEEAANRLFFDVIADRLRTVEPTIVITFGPDGETGHPQHRMTSNATTLAFDATGVGDVLLYGVSSYERRAPISKRIPTYSPGPYSISPRRVSLEVNISKVLHLKMRAMGDHRTQFDAWTLRVMGDLFKTKPVEEFITARSIRKISSLEDLLTLPR